MCSFPTFPLLGNRSHYELDAARQCPVYIAIRIRVKGIVAPDPIGLKKVWFFG